MTISVTTGITSGIDYEEIIDATLEVEQVEIDELETKKEDYETTISAYGAVKSALSTFQDAVSELADADDFYVYSATSSNEEILTVELSGEVMAGTYEIEVIQIAKPQILIGDDGFSSKSEEVGTGTLSISVGDGEAVEIEIGEDQQSLVEIVAAINEADVGVTASIMQVTDGAYALALTAEENGEEITFSVLSDGDGDVSDDSGLSALYVDESESMTVAQDASTAVFSLNGKEFERSTNEIDDLIEGLTIHLEEAEEGTQVTIHVETDTSGLSDKVQAFVDAYNSFMDTLALYQDDSDEDTIGILFGDNTVNRLKSKLQSMIFSSVDNDDSGLTYLSRLGVEMEDDGYLYFDENTFAEALEEDESAVMNFFTNETDGFAVKMNDLLDGYLDTDGIFDAKIDGYETTVTNIEEKIETLEEKLEAYEEKLREKYAALETLLSELQSTQDSVTSLLDSLISSS